MTRSIRLSRSLSLSCLAFCAVGLAAQAQSGSFDTSFGASGLVTTPMNIGGYAYDVAIEPGTNKILTAGIDHYGTGNTQWAVLRYFPDGSLDPSWGAGGKVNLFGAGVGEYAYDIQLDSSGRAVVSGTARLGTRMAFTVVRLNSNGSLDTSFGGTGIVQLQIGTGTSQDPSYAHAIDPATGKIIVAGSTAGKNNEGTKVALVRLNTNGTLDTTFGTGGTRIDNISSLNDTPRQAGLIIQSDGKIVMAASKGVAGQAGWTDWVIARYHSNGTDDTGFGTNGKVFGAFTGLTSPKVWGLAQQADGKLVASGRGYHTPGTYHHLVARYNLNGTLDSSFDGDGWNVTDNALDNQGNRCAIQGDGKIVVAGHAPTFFGSTEWHMFVTRFNTDGSFDTSFDGDGRSQISSTVGVTELGYAVAIDLDGKIVLCGGSYLGAWSTAVARYIP